MVLYFSGTGNSQYLAQKIAKDIKDQLISINELLKANHNSILESDRPWVFVCPTYAWRIPRVVSDFIQRCTFTGNKEAYFILTCGTNTFHAISHIRKLSRKKGFSILGFAEVVMPENYVVLFEASDRDESQERITKATAQVEKLTEIMNKRAVFPHFENTGGLKGALFSGLINDLFYPFVVKAKGFYASGACVSCRKCVKLCPLNNITLVQGLPRRGNACTHCMACISACPPQAIEYKNRTLGKSRYFLQNSLR